jgi:hypothetical protein
MSQNQSYVFPPQNQPCCIPVAFRDLQGNLIAGWTGAATQVYVGGANGVVGAAPVESTNSSSAPGGIGYLNLTAAQMNAPMIEVVCTITNANATAYTATILTSPPYQTSGTSEARPPVWDVVGQIRWIFRDVYNAGQVSRGSGLKTVLQDDSTDIMTTIQWSGTDESFTKMKSSP